LQNCISPPFKDAQINTFDLNKDPEHRTLRQKSEAVNFPERLILYLIETRNYFFVHFRQDVIHAASYLNELRLKVWGICLRATLSASTRNGPVYDYWAILKDLDDLAAEEAKNAPINVDFLYLHGMLSQLTAECLNEWQSIG
jgi:hypothetical protein